MRPSAARAASARPAATRGSRTFAERPIPLRSSSPRRRGSTYAEGWPRWIAACAGMARVQACIGHRNIRARPRTSGTHRARDTLRIEPARQARRQSACLVTRRAGSGQSLRTAGWHPLRRVRLGPGLVAGGMADPGERARKLPPAARVPAGWRIGRGRSGRATGPAVHRRSCLTPDVAAFWTQGSAAVPTGGFAIHSHGSWR